MRPLDVDMRFIGEPATSLGRQRNVLVTSQRQTRKQAPEIFTEEEVWRRQMRGTKRTGMKRLTAQLSGAATLVLLQGQLSHSTGPTTNVTFYLPCLAKTSLAMLVNVPKQLQRCSACHGGLRPCLRAPKLGNARRTTPTTQALEAWADLARRKQPQ